ncbi:MAG: FKBP-type peptidyl-prolyl cis-trans isomerase [Leadbetterella sp.]
MIRNSILCAICTLFLLSSCNKFKVETTKTGERIQFLSKNGKKYGKEGEVVSFDLIIMNAKDSVIRNTLKEGNPIVAPLQKGQFKGSFENALFNIAEGDSAVVLVMSDSLFKVMGTPNSPQFPKGSDVKFKVFVRKFQAMDKFKEEREKEIKDKEAKELPALEAALKSKFPSAIKHTEGIYQVVGTPGTGNTIKAGNDVTVQYVGKLLDGKEFDRSQPNQPFNVKIGEGQVIPGWEIALQKMKKGEKSTFIIPSSLGYGAQGAGGAIPPFATLVFDITVVDVK